MKMSELATRIARVFLPLVIIAAGAVGMMTLFKGAKKPEPKNVERVIPLIEVLEIQPVQSQLMVPSRGIAKPRVKSILTSRVRGEILQVSPALSTGAFFKKGQLLLLIDDKDYKSALATRKAELSRAELTLQLEVKEAEVSKKEWERLMKTKPDPLVLRVPQLAEARARVDAAQAALDQAEMDLERTRILAPYDGQVDERLVDLGRFLNVGTALARIHGIDTAEVRLPLLDSELAFLELPDNLVDSGGIFEGPLVRLYAEFLGRPQEWKARIRRMEGEIDPKTQMVYLVARVEDPYNQQKDATRTTLPMGLYVRAEIQGTLKNNVIVIPRKAMQRAGEVFVLSSKGATLRLHRQKIHILRKQGGEIIIGGGLEKGDRICLTPIDSFVDGMQVKTNQELGAKR
jgi:RND family efflux transporter MFP subunit